MYVIRRWDVRLGGCGNVIGFHSYNAVMPLSTGRFIVGADYQQVWFYRLSLAVIAQVCQSISQSCNDPTDEP